MDICRKGGKSSGLTSPLKFLATLLLLTGSTAPAVSNALILDNPWDTSSLDEWFGESVSRPAESPTVVDSPVCTGNTAVKFPLTFRDDGSGYRNEMVFKGPPKHFPLGEEFWLGFAIYLPEGWEPDPATDILLQFHGWPDSNEGWRNPPLALMTREDYWQVWSLYDSKANSGNPPRLEGSEHFNLGKFETGKWTKWVMRVRFSYGSDGLLEMWKDGEKVLSHKGGNAFNDERGPYLKIGNYKASWREVDSWGGPSAFPYREHFLDSLKIAGSGASIEDVQPACGIAPAAPVLKAG